MPTQLTSPPTLLIDDQVNSVFEASRILITSQNTNQNLLSVTNAVSLSNEIEEIAIADLLPASYQHQDSNQVITNSKNSSHNSLKTANSSNKQINLKRLKNFDDLQNQNEQIDLEQHDLINDILVISSNQDSNHHVLNGNFYETNSLNSSTNDSIYTFNNTNHNQLQPNHYLQYFNQRRQSYLQTSLTAIGSSLNGQDSYTISNIIVKDPIVIRGAGNITVFGVSNKFNDQFPSQLNAKLAPEEFRDTIKQINCILNKELENSFKWLVFGSVFCCCTLGCSFLPVIYMNKKAKLSIHKLLQMENQRLYLKLGLKWKLSKLKCSSNSLLEYVILIEFLPTILLYQPD